MGRAGLVVLVVGLVVGLIVGLVVLVVGRVVGRIVGLVVLVVGRIVVRIVGSVDVPSDVCVFFSFPSLSLFRTLSISTSTAYDVFIFSRYGSIVFLKNK